MKAGSPEGYMDVHAPSPGRVVSVLINVSVPRRYDQFCSSNGNLEEYLTWPTRLSINRRSRIFAVGAVGL
jgi:hypothetical protein